MTATASVLYVQIPAYRDSELAPTLRSLYRNASRQLPMRVRVLWQYGRGETLPDDVMHLPSLEVGIGMLESRQSHLDDADQFF